MCLSNIGNLLTAQHIVFQVYFISVDKMQRAMKRFHGLTEGLWRVCGIRIAVPLLMEHQTYKVRWKVEATVISYPVL